MLARFFVSVQIYSPAKEPASSVVSSVTPNPSVKWDAALARLAFYSKC